MRQLSIVEHVVFCLGIVDIFEFMFQNRFFQSRNVVEKVFVQFYCLLLGIVIEERVIIRLVHVHRKVDLVKVTLQLQKVVCASEELVALQLVKTFCLSV